MRGLGKSKKPTATKAPKALFDLDAKQSIKPIHNHHLLPTFTMEDQVDDSEGASPATTTSPATLPRKYSGKEATGKVNSSTMASPPSEEVVGAMRAAGGDSYQQCHL